MKFVIKPFSEIMIKSKPVRKRYLNYLQTNTNLAVKQIDSNLKASYKWDRGEVYTHDVLNDFQLSQLKKTLARTPGIESYLFVEKFDVSELIDSQEENKNEDIFHFIFQKTQEIYQDRIEGKSFVVRVKRTGKHDFSSIDLERYIGGGLLKYSQSSRVNVKKPDITVGVELREKTLYIVKENIRGIGGYPIGTQDKVVSLISGGFDSGVSTYSMMKRGCKVDYLFFNLGGTAHEVGVKQVAQYLWKTFGSGYKAEFITINFEGVIKELLTKTHHKYRGIILKRLFLKAASMLADQKEYYGIVKGDSLGQVSSQTLKNMYSIDKASETLVLRPLISMNKQEIVDISKNIGTYDFACNMPEYCGVISDKPATGAKFSDILQEEEKFDMSIFKKAVEEKIVLKIDQVVSNIVENNVEIPVVHIAGENDVVVDIREEEKKKKDPLKIESGEIVEIPFYDINNVFHSLDSTKTYLLYCEKGVLSQLHALYLKEQGYDNVKIFRPIKSESSCSL